MTSTVVPRAASRSSVLPVPPSLNNSFFNAARGGRVKSAKYRAWRATAHLSLIAQHVNPRLVAPPYRVTIAAPVKLRIDLDNAIKPLLDVLVAAGVMEDDRHVVEIIARKNCMNPDECVVMVETVQWL